ncbi:p41 capsid protein [Tomato bushy stunt virus]|uniref:Capsid protein n=1 Tax=Tomato bushy stunt virus (strain Cherry) TaxID=12147 RepID=CAPSD_TBSVC|nr:p41 capsid protein [Tomato bushy stunt virus]P11689.1 RecName: Full=Capsid protein; AltName: Full=Coat protein; AltName: Full=p41 [Tomato bushy stunt virus (STRAIN CHERRY)]AAB02536.1 p41 capsid protein [Tomato bushy stunt virus]
MAMVKRNNNTGMIPVSTKQLLALGAAAGATALQGFVKNNGMAIVEGAVDLTKRAYKAVRRRGGKKQQMINHVGGTGGAIMAPVAVTRQLVGSKPKFTGRTSGSVTVTHREYLSQVNNSTGFQVNGGIVGNLLQLNPLNGTLFSWLPAIASNFDQYTFNSVVLHYVPLCSTTEVGRVAIYFDKDSEDPEPADRVELANYSVLKETAPWAEAMLRVPTDKIKRFCDDSSTSDHKLIDLGQLGIATYGGAGTNAVGDIFISYSVTLYFPQPTNTLLSTRRLDLAGALVTASGPGYLLVSRTATVLTMTFRATGTFVISGTYRCLTATTLGLAGGVNVNSITVVDNIGTDSAFFINCTVSNLPSVVTFTSTGITSATVHCVRATRQNDVSLI